MEKAPTLKELLSNRKENHANSIIVSTKNDKDLFKGDVSELPKKLLKDELQMVRNEIKENAMKMIKTNLDMKR